MSLSLRVEALLGQGLLSQAKALLDAEPSLPSSLYATQIHLQTQTGDPQQARLAAEALLKRQVDRQTEIVCLEVIGRSLLVYGRSQGDALRALRKARQLAAEHCSSSVEARLASSHVDALLHWVSLEEAAEEIPALRRLAFKAGDAGSLITTHLLQAEIRTKRMQLNRAIAELRVAQDLLAAHPNVVLLGK